MDPSVIPLTLIALAGLTAWFWINSMAARERALAAGRHACRQHGAQLLDQTVALESLRPVRDLGRLTLDRRYRFEFSYEGDDRHSGEIILRGMRLRQVIMAHPEGRVIQ